MFWSIKKEKNRHIVAVLDYDKSIKSMREGSFYLPYDKEVYFKLFEKDSIKINSLKELGSFIKASRKIKSDVIHFWEGLISEGYTLLNVKYAEKSPSIENLCNNGSIKYIADVKF